MPARRGAALVVLGICALAAAPGCVGGSPQITSYWPGKSDKNVRTNQPIRISFDRPVDRRSVEARFHLFPLAPAALIDPLRGAGIRQPARGAPVPGESLWEGPRQFVFQHAPLATGSEYRVQLDAGYRDLEGNGSWLPHSWSFNTEAPPRLLGSTPGSGERNVDPAAYLVLTFDREMDAGSVAGALSLQPELQFRVRTDPTDGRRLIVAPQSLLSPQRAYSVTLTPEARDVDGNRLRAGSVVSFTTGAGRALRHRVTFIADPAPDQPGAGVWVVDENRVPRQVAPGPVFSFSWSLDGSHLVFAGAGGRWYDLPIGGEAAPLPFQARWAARLGGGEGFAYLDDDRLYQLDAAGTSHLIASGVGEAAVAPGGLNLAYTHAGASGTEVRGYGLPLRAHYRLLLEAGSVLNLAWSPDGSRLAYRVSGVQPASDQLRVRILGGSGTSRTVADGTVGAPLWQPDSRHLVFTALVETPAGTFTKLYRVDSQSPPPRLSPSQALPATSLDVRDPAPSPDGRQIAFAAEQDGRMQVWLMNVDGSGLTQLTAFDQRLFPYSSRALSWTRT